VLVFDVVRFATITLGGVPVSGAFIYSDNTDGVDAVADTPSPPFPLLTNQATATEVGTEGQNTATYTPVSGQPGFLANPAGVVPPVTYTFTSDQPPPVLVKAFTNTSLQLLGPGNSTTLTFTLTNPQPVGGSTMTNVQFTDNLPAGLIISSPNGVTSTCNVSATITAPANTGTIAVAGVTLAPQASCTITVNVTATQIGVWLNRTTPITAFQVVCTAVPAICPSTGLLPGLIGNTASATVSVDALFFTWFFLEGGGGSKGKP
jgi:uncharacterized repeat protein (TIGR01451 family)